MRNGPRHHHLEDVNIGDKVRVWRESTKSERDKWTGPFELYDKEGEIITVLINSEKKNFRSTSVKKWFDENSDPNARQTSEPEQPQPQLEQRDQIQPETELESESPSLELLPRRSQRTGRFTGQYQITQPNNTFTESSATQYHSFAYLNQDDEAVKLSLELRAKGLITTPGLPFQFSNKKEIDGLLSNEVFRFLPWNKILAGRRIYKCRMVKSIKGKETLLPFEKSRLVIQAYNDQGKSLVLTQSPTVQRASQRLILCLAICLISQYGHTLFLRDIQQAYTQSRTHLVRDIYC
ncbi:hypothetical protein K3495_g6421 [Podosphaera aphanis]|nr:hypothetical protein K3495_g6421 [Podosphaera aphanis]